MTEELIQKLIDLVQKGAPVLWAIARRQVLNSNVMDFLVALILIAVSVVLFKFIKKLRNEDARGYDDEKEKGCFYIGETEYDASKIFGYIAIAVMGIFIMTNTVSIVMRFVNPDYYALQILIELIK
jgi:hypothetical protein